MSYGYCDECGAGILGPWDLDTVELLRLALIDSFVADCKSCKGTAIFIYSAEDVIEELALRIDRKTT